MRLTNLMAAAVALSMLSTSAFAVARNPASRLSLADADAAGGSPTKHGSHATGLLIAGVAVAAVVVSAIALGHNHRDSMPASA